MIHGIADPREYFKDKSLRVTGKITLYRDAPQIEVTEPEQLEVVSGEG